MDKERIFYANTVLFSVSKSEAVFIFGLRPVEKTGEVKEPDEKGDDKKEQSESDEIARVHIPRALADLIIRDMAKRYEEEQRQEETSIEESLSE